VTTSEHTGEKSPDSFESFFQRDLLHVLRELEVERKSIRNTLLYPTIGLGSLALLLVFMLPNLGIQTLILTGITGAGLFTWFKTKASREFRSEFKQQVIRSILQHIDPDLRYNAHGRIKRNEFMASSIFTKQPDRYHGEDLIGGELGETSFSFSEVHAQIYVKDSEGKRKLQTQFKGLFFKADMNKHIRHRTIITPDIAERFLGDFGQQLQKLNYGRDDLVQLENVEFEKLYAVYGTDQVEARYILTPRLMERLVEFHEVHGFAPYLSFLDSQVHVAMPIHRDFFEPRIFRSLLDMESCRVYHDDMELALSMVDELDLNTRIWSKRPDSDSAGLKQKAT